MKRHILALAAAAGFCLAPASEAGKAKPFGLTSVHFEQNTTDKDYEVVFEVNGDSSGLVKLLVVAPDGRTVIDFKAPEFFTVGIRQFRLESPEPGNVESLESSYPQGVYRFSAITATGGQLEGKATLRHGFPAAAKFLGTLDGADSASKHPLSIDWEPVEGLDAFLVDIEQESQNVSVSARLSGSAARFGVPDGFMLPDTEYKLAISTVGQEGNITIVEKTIRTAPAPK